jgi:hypothetical protein
MDLIFIIPKTFAVNCPLNCGMGFLQIAISENFAPVQDCQIAPVAI